MGVQSTLLLSADSPNCSAARSQAASLAMPCRTMGGSPGCTERTVSAHWVMLFVASGALAFAADGWPPAAG